MSSTGKKKSGRPSSDSVLQHITITEEEDGTWKQICNHCGCQKSSKQVQATRWAEHLVLQCQACSPAIKRSIADTSSSRSLKDKAIAKGVLPFPNTIGVAANQFFTPVEGSSSISMGTTAGSSGCGSAATVNMTSHLTTEANSKRRKILEFETVASCSKEKADRITQTIMKFLAGCGLPMLIVESPFFIEMLSELNAAYVQRYLPKADAFTRTWLPLLHKSTEAKVSELWGSSCNTYRSLASDGFTGEDHNKVNILTEAKLDKVSTLCTDILETSTTKCMTHHQT